MTEETGDIQVLKVRIDNLRDAQEKVAKKLDEQGPVIVRIDTVLAQHLKDQKENNQLLHADLNEIENRVANLERSKWTFTGAAATVGAGFAMVVDFFISRH